MKTSVRIVSSLSIAALGIGAAVPAFAYVASNSTIVTTAVASVTAKSSLRERATTPKARPITSRQIERQYDDNVFANSRERGTAVADDTGRVLLPTRSAWRQPSLRNTNRHLLGRKRGGTWHNTEHFVQGDMRRRPVGQAALTTQEDTEESVLPPTIVQTGGNILDNPSRRTIRGDRDLNDENRR